MARVFRENTVVVARLRRFPFLPARRKFLCRHVKLDQSLVLVEGDRITIFH